MRGCRLGFISALAIALIVPAPFLLASGCAQPPRDEAAAPAHALPAPKDPDLGSVMERFYQQVEGNHWRFAYAMLAPAYRARLSEADLVAHYGKYASLDVTLRQQSDTTVVAHLAGTDRSDGRPLRDEETVKLGWDGADWKIVDLRWVSTHLRSAPSATRTP
jgi:hypothetical protein